MITEEEIKKEKKHLELVNKKLKEELDTLGFKNIKEEENYKEFQKMMWDDFASLDAGDIASRMEEDAREVSRKGSKYEHFKRLKNIENNPFFASIIFEDEDGEEFNIYISTTYLRDKDENILYDWRSPICSLYYDYELGPSEYDAPGGVVKGVLKRKRQYKIKNKKLISVFDSNLNITDEFLQDALASNTSDKLKSIVNTIQKEQNRVIRDTRSDNLIVEGLAGSGKTTVALHRIAYLLYKEKDLTSSKILIFSPNNVFSEYISGVLPSLGERNTKETTFHEYLGHFLTEYKGVESYTHFLSRYYMGEEDDEELVRYKQSDEILRDLIYYLNDFEKNASFNGDIILEKNLICKKELNDYLHYKYNRMPLFERLDEIASKLSERFYKGTQKKKTTFKRIIKETINFDLDFKNIYSDFFKSKYSRMKLSDDEIKSFINKKEANYEDALLITFIKGKLEGYKTDLLIKEVVVDEAQDYNILEYVILKNIFKKAHFTILGDTNQNINPYYHYDSLETLKGLFKGDTNFMMLNKTYRSSPEIINFSNKILGLNHVNAIRNETGKDVIIRKNIADLKKSLEDDINYLKDLYTDIAIITKDDNEAEKIYKLLASPEITLLKEEDKDFNKNIIIVPAYLSKGLEFGGVIIYNDRVNSFKGKEKNLLYVAVTRAEHELIVYN